MIGSIKIDWNVCNNHSNTENTYTKILPIEEFSKLRFGDNIYGVGNINENSSNSNRYKGWIDKLEESINKE